MYVFLGHITIVDYSRKNHQKVYSYGKTATDSTVKWCARFCLLHLGLLTQIVAENPPTLQHHCQVAVWPPVPESWWRTLQNDSKNNIFTKQNGGQKK